MNRQVKTALAVLYAMIALLFVTALNEAKVIHDQRQEISNLHDNLFNACVAGGQAGCEETRGW